MSRLIRVRNAKARDGKVTQHALYDIGCAFVIIRWDEATLEDRQVEEIEYHGNDDRRAARAMAMGALDSLHRQAMAENE